MIINHPLFGPRDAEEFVYLGDASLLDRPDKHGQSSSVDFARYLYQRENPVGVHQELWFHEFGDQSWLIVTRDTRTHAIRKVEFARDAALARKAQ